LFGFAERTFWDKILINNKPMKAEIFMLTDPIVRSELFLSVESSITS
jgi:hypothetical protein